MFIVLRIALAFILTGCTYSITMVHTQGEANDVVDEEQKADADIKPNINVPAI